MALLSTRRLTMYVFCICALSAHHCLELQFFFFELGRTGKDFGWQALHLCIGVPVCKDIPLCFLFVSLQIEGGFVCFFIKSHSIYKIIAFKNIHYTWKRICFLQWVKGSSCSVFSQQCLAAWSLIWISFLLLLFFGTRFH